ncbi:uncharacterized protein [Channa argus]|uniref:uncharacterized protein n=2 Tax=Channa argus TaxID=215402 RepID=UPI00352179D3
MEHHTEDAEGQHAKAGLTHSDNQLKTKKKERSQITVRTSQKKDGKRIWDKSHYCLYCKKSNLKMARHLERKHMDEIDVAHAFSFPTGSKKRKTLLDSLRNKGDWQHNLKVLQEGEGEIVTWKQPSKKASVEDYLPCQHCYAMFRRTELWRHEKSCRVKIGEKGKGKRRRVQKASSKLIPIRASSEGIQKVIHSMLQDNVTCQVRSDEMICTYGDALFAKKGREQSQHRYIAQKMRELGRLVLAAREIDKSVKGLQDLCDPTKFHLVVKAARRVSNYNTNKVEYGKPSTAVKIGFSLKGATEAWIGSCLMTSNILGEKKAKKFKELLDNSWSSYVSANAHSTMEQRKWHNEDCVPLTEDVITLQKYLRKIEDEAKAELSKRVSTTAYKMLSESLLAQIIIFNKKREGEASRLTLDTFLKADSGPVNKDIYETLSPVEQQLSHRLTRLVTRGKRGRKVPVLLLERTKSSLEYLIKKRSEVGVLDENPFLFARIGTTTNIRGCDCLRKYAEKSKVSHPELLRSTKLRKHVATLCQLLDLDNQELEQVARFMGHDIRVHCEYYRQTDKTFQVAKIGKLLFAMEHGAQSLKGKSLKTLDSVVFGHEGTTKKGFKQTEQTETSDGDILKDREHLQLTMLSSPVKSQRTVTSRGHDSEDEVNADDAEDEANADDGEVKKKTASKRRLDESESDDEGGEVKKRTTGRTLDKRRKETASKRRHDESDDEGGEVKKRTTGRTLDKRWKETASKRRRDESESDDEGGEVKKRTTGRTLDKRWKKTASKRHDESDGSNEGDSSTIKVRRPWTEQEKTAVQKNMAKFVALRRVPAKNDCLLCIGKASPVLSARTWKDVKYFVYNEIVKIKRKLAF